MEHHAVIIRYPYEGKDVLGVYTDETAARDEADKSQSTETYNR